jgi:hypothetical protein
LLYHVKGGRTCAGVGFLVADLKTREEKSQRPVKTDRGTCPTCKRSVVLKADGHLRSHNDNSGHHCLASGAKAINIIRAPRPKKVGKPGSRSVRALGGGLPGLGKHR